MDLRTMAEHRPGCFCEFCMKLDTVRLLRANLAKAEQSLRALDEAQRMTPEALNKIIDAQRYDIYRDGTSVRRPVSAGDDPT